MKKIALLFLALILGMKCFALEVVYPKSKSMKTAANASFFVGSASPDSPLKINNAIVEVHKSGGFAYYVPLNAGVNTFTLESCGKTLTYSIERLPQQAAALPSKFIKYDCEKVGVVSKDRVPLRSTPIDGGINRLAHYQEGLALRIDGEQGNFYRVVLTQIYNDKDFVGWIAKRDVKIVEDTRKTGAKLKSSHYAECDNYITSTYRAIGFVFDNRVPYVIEEKGSDKLLLMFHYLNNKKCHYEFSPPLIEKLVGYGEYYDGDTFVLKIRKYPKSLKELTVVIDPGHGGSESGAIGCLGHKEKDINLAISQNLKKELESRGIKVVMTREDDQDVGLYDRVEVSNLNDAAVLISIHANAIPDGQNPTKARGTSVYYYYNQAKPLADSVLQSMTNNLGTKNDRVRQGSLALVRNTISLSILVEVGYMINPEDNALLIDPEFQKNAAEAIADGIQNYFCDLK